MRNAIRHITILALLLTAGKTSFTQYLKKDEGSLDQVVVQNKSGYTVVRPLETMSQSMLLYNSSKQPIRLKVVLRPNRYFRALANFQDNVLINPNDSVALKVRLINSNARVNGIYTLFFDLINKDDSSDISTLEYKVEVVDGIDQQFAVQPLQENLFIYQQSKEISVPVLFKNMLPEYEKVTLQIRDNNIPFRLDPSLEKGFILPPKDTIITVKLFQVNQLRQLVAQYQNITVVLKNEKGDIVSTFSLNPNFVLSKGSMNVEDIASLNGKSFVESNYYMFGNSRSGFDLRMFKPFEGNDDKTSFAFNYQQYAGSNGILNNTFFNYRSEHASVQLGSQSDIHEMALFGRGVKATLNMNEDHTTKMELWGVDQQFNILEPLATKGTRTISTRFSTNLTESSSIRISSNLFQRNVIQSKGHLHFIEYNNRISNAASISMRFGGSMERFSMTAGDSTLPGWSGMLRYEFTRNRFSMFGDIYHASRDYAGLMQGSTIILSGISYGLPHDLTLSAAIQKNTTDRPNYAPGQIIGRTYYNYTTYELTLGKSSAIGQFYIKPYLQQQGQEFLYGNTASGVPTSNSKRLLGGYNGRIKKLSINTQFDFGMTQFTNIPNATTAGSLRSTIGLNYKNLSTNIVFQKGIFFINDLLSSVKDPANHKSFFVNTQYSFTYRNLSSQTSINVFHYNSYNSINAGLFQSVSYKIGKGFTATAQSFVNLSGANLNTQFRVGARKELNVFGGEDKKVALQLKVFIDKNGNKFRDNDETLAPGITVKIDDIMMITDEKGRITLSGMKTGWHTIKILYSSGVQQNLLTKDIDLDKNEKVEIGIPPQHIVRGSLKQIVGKYEDKLQSLEGIKISFRSGSKDIITYTDSKGEFYMQLPSGAYSVAIDRLRSTGDNKAIKEIIIDPAKGCKETIELQFSSFSRQVDIKKF